MRDTGLTDALHWRLSFVMPCLNALAFFNELVVIAFLVLSAFLTLSNVHSGRQGAQFVELFHQYHAKTVFIAGNCELFSTRAFSVDCAKHCANQI